jgi:hypothetical protein
MIHRLEFNTSSINFLLQNEKHLSGRLYDKSNLSFGTSGFVAPCVGPIVFFEPYGDSIAALQIVKVQTSNLS